MTALATSVLLALTTWSLVPAAGLALEAGSGPAPSFDWPQQALTVTQTGPTFEQIVNLGVAPGNTTTPRHLALDASRGLLYLVGDGIPQLAQGNDLSLFDIEAGEFVKHTKVAGQFAPLDLQLDPASERLYLLRQAPFGSEVSPTLTIFAGQSLQLLEELPNVVAIAVADNLLYTAELDRLTRYTVEGDKLSQQSQTALPPTSEISHLAFNLAANRLYLARFDAAGWGLDIYQADTLNLISTFATEDRVTDLLPNPATQELFVFQEVAGDRWVQRLDAAGRPREAAYRLSRASGGAGLALSPNGQQLYFSNDELPAPTPNPDYATVPTLVGLTTAGFVPQLNLPLPARFNDLVIDPVNNQAFAVSPFENLLTVIDLAKTEVQQINTAVEIRDLLVDPASGDLFVSDSGNGLRRLDSDTFASQAATQRVDEAADSGLSGGLGAGELALDDQRDRLYVSGFPAYVLEADTLTQLELVTPGGQFSPDPDNDRLYLSHCGLALLDVTSLVSQSVVPGSTRRDDQLVPNPCVGHSRLDALNQRLYSLAPNGVPGSNGGNLLYVYDVALTPTLIFSDVTISAVQVEPDPTGNRAFVRHQQGAASTLRSLAFAPPEPPTYTHSLSGLSGSLRYSPATNRLYLSDGSRLLTLDADSLTVIAELPLPLNYNYRLVGLDADQGRLYLAGNDGQLLLARETEGRTRSLAPAPLAEDIPPLFAPSQQPNGAILGLDPLADGATLARIETDYDFQRDTRLFLTTDEGQSWRNLSQSLPAGFQLQDVAILPGQVTTPTLLVALNTSQDSGGGIYRSADGGQSWQPAMAGLRDLAVNRLIVSPQANEGLLLANTVRAGLHLSLDQGQSWQPVGEIDPTKPNQPLGLGAAAISREGVVLATRRVEAEAGGLTGLYRASLSQTTGPLSTWQPVLDLPLSLVAFAPTGQMALAYGEGLWRSDDGGLSWQPGGAGLTDLDLSQTDQILFSPNFAEDETVYLFFRDIRGDASGRLFRSTDAGVSWQQWDNPPASRRFTAVALTSTGEMLLGDDETGLTNLAASDMLWADPPSPTTPFPLDDVAVSPDFAADSTVFAINHLQGLFRSTDGGDSWQQSAFPVRSTSFEGYRLALSPAYAQDQTLYVATGFSLHRSTDGADTWQSLVPAAGQSSFPAQRLALSPNFESDQTLLVATSQAILRSTDGGDSWEQVLLRPETAGQARLLGFASAGPAYVWFDYDSTLFVSANGGRRWQARPGAAGAAFAVATAAIGPDGTVVLRPDFAPQLIQIEPSGQTRQNLDNVLPPDFGAIEVLTYTPDGSLLAGGSGGLLRSGDNGASWQAALKTGPLAQAEITQLQATDTDLFVGLRDGRLFHFDGQAGTWQEISVVR